MRRSFINPLPVRSELSLRMVGRRLLQAYTVLQADGCALQPLPPGEHLRLGRPQLGTTADHAAEISAGCFPPASPAVVTEAGKHKSRKAGPLGQLLLLRKIGAGEGIRTLDPDLGKALRDWRDHQIRRAIEE